MLNFKEILSQTTERSQEVFKAQKRVLSYQQWLEAFLADPARLGRNAPQYLLDCYEYYGSCEVDGIGEKERRWNLFDAPFDAGRDKMIGHEDAQNEVYDLLKRFAVTGKADRLVLMHGPNGSGKSTLIDLLVRALEAYSRFDEGAVFSFNWLFTERLEGSSHMGFAARADLPKDSLVFADENLISCRIVNELREHPIFLIPRAERERLLDRLLEERKGDARSVERLKGDYLREGDLSAKSKAIFEALVNAYRGDWMQVIRHVQVERYFVSKRFRVASAAIEPQQHTDGGARPITFEQGAALPPVLSGLQLMELNGELIDASGGIVEYSDILKRPLEMNKYLLNTCERGTVTLRNVLAHLNVVMMGTCNEKYLSAFKANPDFTSFKGRIELARMGYLLEWRKEREVYRDFLDELRGERHVAPHTLDVAALWSVMTRLRRPDPENYDDDVASILKKLTPLEKARLYGEHRAPERLNTDQKRALLAAVPQLRDEFNEALAEFENFVCAAYEGRRGASAREMRALLADAVQNRDQKCLSPLAVFQELENLLKDRSVYDFLRLEPDEGYQDPEAFIDEVTDEYYRWVMVEAYDSMELIEEKEFERRVEEYFRHVRGFVSGEKIENPRSGVYEPASASVMEGLEKLMDLKEPAESFRKNVMTKIAAWSLEHPKVKLSYAEVFPDLIYNLRGSYYKQKQKDLETLARYILSSGTEDAALVPKAQLPRVEATLKTMREKYGYCDACAKEALSFMLRRANKSAS
ncbi:MAG: serine protein kinase PrkA [Planctomycetota bacterium]|nr:serine protein kinase PrkA [Planctomycetota bacterium]